MGIPPELLNCLTETCCDAARAEQGYAKWLTQQGIPEPMARKCAAETFEYFELAERGTLTAFKQSIVRVYNARG